jgi:glycosyltransferase involved in cell wall biosynthesis
MPQILIHFARFGPYHRARLRSAAEALKPQGWEVSGLETAGTDATYAWDETTGASAGPPVVTAFPGRVYEAIRAPEARRVLYPLLDRLKPAVMVIAGWSGPDALACLSWCRRNDVPAIVMSETREADGKRVWWKERIKRWILARFRGALVGGKSHRGYLVKLGMPADSIALGYNVVDNGYFAAEAGKWRERGAGDRGQRSAVGGQPSGGRGQRSAVSGQEAGDRNQPSATIDQGPGDRGTATKSKEQGTKNKELGTSPYFLASNRFIERKNLARLVEAYARYVALNEAQGTKHEEPSTTPWPLVLLGDGELKPALIAQCQALGLNVIESAPWESSLDKEQSTKNDELPASPAVFLPGFRQIEELPRFYAHAGCFIHPALEEPWGLVINEAMACGLPVLSSRNVGAAEELVDDGVNGGQFDPENPDEIAQLMLKISAHNFPLSAFSTASRRILEERAPLSAFGEGLLKLLQGAALPKGARDSGPFPA